LPRFAIGQADDRPSLTIAVQKISTSNTLEPMREQSNVGQRIFCTFAETLSDHAWTGDRSLRPGLADTFRRIDARALELKLRENVRFHNGDGMTAQDVAFSFGLERMWTGQWENEEMPRLMEALQDSTDMDKRRATFRRMLTLTEREAPAYNGIHQNATFTAKRRNYKRRPAQSFVVDFRASNWG
jgi:ABC-type transport system substrate-binding protein